MSLIIGIDEVGYGPKLGPLIISAVAVKTTDVKCDLWKLLRDIVVKDKSRNKKCRKLVVCDSKKLYSRSGGIRHIEETSLAFLSVFTSDVNNILLPANVPYPWYNSKIDIPLSTDVSVLHKKGSFLKRAIATNYIELCDIRLRVIEPEQFNNKINLHGNKSQLLFYEVAHLIKDIIATNNDDDVAFYIGKQGGRNFYYGDIRNAFSDYDTKILEEGKKQSRYILGNGRRKIAISFLIDGEDRHFLISLASIIGKYAREIRMILFNRYWANVANGVKPTAGYGIDAERFLNDINQWLTSGAVDLQQVVRSR